MTINGMTPSQQGNITEIVSDSVLSPEERSKILYDWNNTRNEYASDKTIHELFEKQAADNPDSTALLFNGKSITYAELNARANQLAHYLRGLGVKPDNLVAVSMEASFDLFIAILGILKAGCAYVPLDPNYPEERRQFMLDDTQAVCLLTHSGLRRRFIKSHAQLVCVDRESERLARESTENPRQINGPENLLYVIYTSGSTGRPKGVMLTHHNVHNFINWFSQALAVKSDDVFDFSSSISFDFSVATTLFPLVCGGKVAICREADKKDPDLYIRHLHENKVSVIKLTPSYFRQLKEFIKPGNTFSDLRWIVFGGESLLKQDIKDWLATYPKHQILNEYGPTETAVATSWIVVNQDNIEDFGHGIPIGKPAYNTRLFILDSRLTPVPVGMEAELYIGGEGVAKGYLHQPGITAERFINDPFNPGSRLYKTGDLCRYLPDGNIEFIGRVDHQVKIRGFRIETAEIEMRLAALECIREAVVIARADHADETGEKRLVAYCLLKDKTVRPEPRFLREYLHKSLPEYMIPAAFVLMDAFPLSPNGKLDRWALPEPEETNYHYYHAPRTALEQIISDIWCEVLNLKLISVDDNFFELGGHSLSGARIISKLIKATNKDIKLADLYQAPTISELANVISHAVETDKKIVSSKKRRSGSAGIPLSDMQLLLWVAQKSYSKAQSLNIVARKRLSDKLDPQALQYAFECTLKSHDILRYHVPRYIPLQYPQGSVDFRLDVRDISALTPAEQEQSLASSLAEYKVFHAWKKGESLVRARLFQLSGDKSEIQIAIAHVAGDEISHEIVFADLSRYYLNYRNNIKTAARERVGATYQDYALEERENLDATLRRDMPFWKDYLKDISLFVVPESEIINEIRNDEFYTSYLEIAEEDISRLQLLCMINRMSLQDCLSAAVGSVFSGILENRAKPLVLSVVKSTRHDDIYDHTIGFFVRTDLLKFNPSASGSLIETARQVQKSTAESAPHQFCPGIVKLAYLYQNKWQGKKIRNGLIGAKAYALSKMCPSLQLHDQVLKFYGKMLIAETRRHFLVQVNVLNNFINLAQQSPSRMFGSKLENLASIRDDRIVGKNVLEICFERDSHNKPFLVISGNISQGFREQAGRDILNALRVIK